MAVTVDTKIFLALYTGASLTLNTTNAPWLSNVVKIIRPSLNSGINTRQSYNGAYNGATPGGAVSTLSTGLLYEITAGATNGWSLPDFTRAPSATAPAEATELLVTLPGGANALAVDVQLEDSADNGSYVLNSAKPTTGVSSLTFKKNGSTVSVSTSLAVALTTSDVLLVTGSTASGVKGRVHLIKQ